MSFTVTNRYPLIQRIHEFLYRDGYSLGDKEGRRGTFDSFNFSLLGPEQVFYENNLCKLFNLKSNTPAILFATMKLEYERNQDEIPDLLRVTVFGLTNKDRIEKLAHDMQDFFSIPNVEVTVEGIQTVCERSFCEV